MQSITIYSQSHNTLIPEENMANVFVEAVSMRYLFNFMAILKVTACDYVVHISNILATLSHMLFRLVNPAVCCLPAGL